VSAVAYEKLSAELTFEIADLLRQRRCRNMKTLRGSAEMQLFCNRDEVAQLSEFHWIDRTVHTVIGDA
jgi:hypothetical protein